MYDFVLGHIHSHPEPHAAHRLQVGHPWNLFFLDGLRINISDSFNAMMPLGPN